MTRILILCTGNSSRSQMAEYLLRNLDPTLDVCSAGTAPATHVHPKAIAVMKEVNIDMTGAVPKSVDRFLNDSFDYVITVCDHARETCPVFPGTVRHRLHIGFEDPAEAIGTDDEILAVFRRVRDQIRDSFQNLYSTEIRNNKQRESR